jgi:alginate O-acetyltransferase complex protein AlgI
MYASGLMITFFLLGLWHGAGWNFILFGVIHGIYVTLEFIIRRKFPYFSNHSFFNSKIGKTISIFVTQYLIFFAWIPFTIRDTDTMFMYMQKFVFLDFMLDTTIPIIIGNKFPIGIMLVFIILHLFSYKNKNLHKTIANLKMPLWALFLFVIGITILFFYDGQAENFIYFEF